MSLAALLATALAAAPVVQTPAPPAPPVASPAPTPDETHDFSDLDSRMTLPVTISGSGPHDFIVDTGSERTVISRELATLLGLAAGRQVRITAMADRVSVPTVIIPLITVGSLGAASIEAPALERRNLGAPGLLGLDSLQGKSLGIDFDANRMTVVRASKRSRASAPVRAGDIVVRAKSMFGQLVLTDAFYRGRRIRVVIDTGSEVSMGNLALRDQVRARKLLPISLLSVTGARLAADYTQVERVTVAGVDIVNLPIAFADAAPFERFGLIRRPALLLGMDALRLFRRVDVDFANREIRFALPRTAHTARGSP